MKRRTVVTLIVATALTAAIAAACVSKSAEAACNSGKDCLPAMAFEDLDRHRHSHDTLKNKIVVVNFWATWCGPCKKEIPAFNRIYNQYKDRGVVMFGMLQDNTVDDAGLLNFMSDFELTYPVVRATDDILGAFEYPNALPTTFIYDRKGKVRMIHRGPLEESQLAAQLDKLL